MDKDVEEFVKKRKAEEVSETAQPPLPAESDKKEEDNGMGGKIFLKF